MRYQDSQLSGANRIYRLVTKTLIPTMSEDDMALTDLDMLNCELAYTCDVFEKSLALPYFCEASIGRI